MISSNELVLCSLRPQAQIKCGYIFSGGVLPCKFPQGMPSENSFRNMLNRAYSLFPLIGLCRWAGFNFSLIVWKIGFPYGGSL